MPKIIDLVDQKFDDLTVKEAAGKDEKNNRLWLCECTCGNTILATSYALRSGRKKNCGCKQSLINQKFGDLTVKEIVAASNWGLKILLCECVCGNTIKVSSETLKSGLKTNCGCKQKEQKTKKEILKLDKKTKKETTSHNEKIFSGCVDFWICSDNDSDLRSPSLENMQILVKKEMILKLTKKALEKITSIAKLDLFLAFLTGQRTF